MISLGFIHTSIQETYKQLRLMGLSHDEAILRLKVTLVGLSEETIKELVSDNSSKEPKDG